MIFIMTHGSGLTGSRGRGGRTLLKEGNIETLGRLIKEHLVAGEA